MFIQNLHHLAVPCLVDIKEIDESYCQTDEIYYLNPAVVIRYEPGGAVITSPMLYSSFLFVDEELAELFKKRWFSSKGIPNYILSALIENEIISLRPPVGQRYKEINVEINGLPTQVLLDVTSFCTCDCITCYHKSDLDSYVPPLKDILARITKLKELGVGLFEVTGGEPFSRNDLAQILGYLKQLELNYYVVTNGEFLLNSSDNLINLLKDGLGIGISLDGVGTVHDRVRQRPGLYDKIIKGADKMFSKGVKIYFIATLNRENIADVEEMIAVAKKYDTTIHFRPTIKTGAAVLNNLERIDVAKELGGLLKHPNVRNGLLNTKKIIAGARYYGCGIRKRISVDSHGILYPCVMDRSHFFGNIENYTSASLVEELENETRKLLRQNESCRDCIHNKDGIVCGGFCRFSNRYKTMKRV